MSFFKSGFVFSYGLDLSIGIFHPRADGLSSTRCALYPCRPGVRGLPGWDRWCSQR